MSTETKEKWLGEPGQIGSYFLRASGEVNEIVGRVSWSNVIAWEIIATNGDSTVGYFKRLGADSPTDDMVTTPDQAAPYLEGFIKWDGCSEFDWKDTHSCGKRGAVRIGEVVGALYDLAKELMQVRPDDMSMYMGE